MSLLLGGVDGVDANLRGDQGLGNEDVERTQ